MIDTSVEALSDNVRRLCGSLAQEIANRCTRDDLKHSVIERHATAVLIDWFLGDFIPDYGQRK